MKRKLSAVLFTALIAIVLGHTGIVSSAQAATPNCSLKTLKKSYGYSVTGTIPGLGDIAAVGSFTADGKGNITGADTVALSNDVIEKRTATGTYTVNEDCTGSISLDFIAPTMAGVANIDIVIVEKGKKLRGLQTTPTPPAPDGTVITFVAERM